METVAGVPDEDTRGAARLRRPARRLVVAIGDELGRPARARGLAAWLGRVAPARAVGRVGIALVSDARIRALNRVYRRKDCVTDVLSFPAGPLSAPRGAGRTRFLGDIVIATGVAARQAADAGHDEATELRVLALHGLLHLLGYDHERDAGQMERVERRLRRKGRLREGLIERAQR
jgi:probable rRNA maturation factor